MRFVLDSKKLGTKSFPVKDKGNKVAHGMVIVLGVPVCVGTRVPIYLHVGFCVARLDWIGTWKGRSEWDEQRKRIPRFLFYMP